jgi:acetate kinase
MQDAIVVLNAGSSSLKFSLYVVEGEDLRLEAKGQVEGLGTSPRFTAKNAEGKVLAEGPVGEPGGDPTQVKHAEAYGHLATWVRAEYRGELRPLGVGHRIVHGGAEFTEPTLINAAFVKALEALVPLMPLHLPHNLAGVKGVLALRPDLPQVACFDTSFHRGRAKVTERFALPDELFQKGVRRWGFHGLSYEYIAAKFRKLQPELAKGRVVVAHLGSGASLCGMKNARSVDVTMGFSALDGLPMGTRCGALDPGVVLYLLEGRSAKEVESLLYKNSGLLGISGVSNDVRELLASDEPLAAEAIDYFVYRVIKEIGGLMSVIGGLDALIFTAGIGENSPVIRERVCAGLGWAGIQISAELNRAGRGCISPAGVSPSVWVIPTDEERVIATHTCKIIRAAGGSG